MESGKKNDAQIFRPEKVHIFRPDKVHIFRPDKGEANPLSRRPHRSDIQRSSKQQAPSCANLSKYPKDVEVGTRDEKQLFMDGEKTIANISEAESAGVSLQADKTSVNQSNIQRLPKQLTPSCANLSEFLKDVMIDTDMDGEKTIANISETGSAGVSLQADKTAANQFPKRLSHGTAVIWVRLSDTHLYVAVDSKSNSKIKDLTLGSLRGYFEITRMGNEKFRQFHGLQFTVIGNSDRFNEMLDYVEQKLAEEQLVSNFSNIRKLASKFIVSQLLPADEDICQLYICGWIQEHNRYDVYLIQDGLKEPHLITHHIFGGGSGFPQRLDRLNSVSKENIGPLIYEMLRASAIDSYTGGAISVWSLENNSCPDHPVLITSLIDELKGVHRAFYDPFVFNENNIFVVISQKDEEVLSPSDLVFYLEGFIPTFERSMVNCLHLTNCFLVYLVSLPSKDICNYWFDMGCTHPATEGSENCQKSGTSFRIRCFRNEDGSPCSFGLALSYPRGIFWIKPKGLRHLTSLFHSDPQIC